MTKKKPETAREAVLKALLKNPRLLRGDVNKKINGATELSKSEWNDLKAEAIGFSREQLKSEMQNKPGIGHAELNRKIGVDIPYHIFLSVKKEIGHVASGASSNMKPEGLCTILGNIKLNGNTQEVKSICNDIMNILGVKKVFTQTVMIDDESFFQILQKQ